MKLSHALLSAGSGLFELIQYFRCVGLGACPQRLVDFVYPIVGRDV
jgi:hypothetical protein